MFLLLVQIDSLRVRVLSYIQADQSKQVYVRKLETDLTTVQRELAESRKENERLKEAHNVDSDASSHAPARSGQADPEMLRRHLRHSRKIVYDLLGDRVRLSTVCSLMFLGC